MLQSTNQQSLNVGGASIKEAIAMFEHILYIAAAIATIASFILEIWKECKQRLDSTGKKMRR